MDTNVATISDIVSSGGIGALLLVILLGAFKGWWVPGWIHRDAIERIRALEDRIERVSKLTVSGTELLQRLVDSISERDEKKPYQYRKD